MKTEKESESPALPRKQPQQQRSRILFESVKEACLKILENEGVDKLTVTRLTEVAGVTMGSLYQYFPNVEAVVTAIYEDEINGHRSALYGGLQDALEMPELEKAMRSTIDLGVTYERKLLDINKKYYQKYHDHFSFRDGIPEKTYYQKMVTKLLVKHAEERGIQDPEMKAFMWTEAIILLDQQCIAHHPDYYNNEKFSDYLFDMVMGLINPAR